MTSQATNTPEIVPRLGTHPCFGVAGVLPGAMIATCAGRLMSVGLADIRGALHLTATGRTSDVLALQIKQQAFTLAISDSFILLATCSVACQVVVAFISTMPTQYHQIIASSSEAK
jgi:hypothetical protein